MAGILLALILAQGLIFTRTTGQTTDEACYAGAGYLMARYHYYPLMEHPPLLLQLGALPLLFLRPDFSLQDAVMVSGTNIFDCARTGAKFLYQSGNASYEILFWTRLPMVLLIVLLGGVLFQWGSRLYGNAGALLALALLALEPNMLSHGSLYTTDAGLAVFVFLAAAVLGKFFRHPGPQSLLFAGVLAGLALLTKISAFILFPAFGAVFLIYFLGRKNQNPDCRIGERVPAWAAAAALGLLILALGQRITGLIFGPLCLIPIASFLFDELRTRRKSALWFWLAALVLAAALLASWLPFALAVKKLSLSARLAGSFWALGLGAAFLYSRRRGSGKMLAVLLNAHSFLWILAGFVIFLDYTDFPARMLRFKPFTPFIDTFQLSLAHTGRYHVQCLGGSFIQCDWRYFLTAMAAKTPLAHLGLFLLGLIGFWRARLVLWEKALILLPPLLFFLAASFLNKIHIGLRHALTVYPFLMLIAGFSVPLLQSVPQVFLRRLAFAALLAGVGFSGFRHLSQWPHGLSYFSEWVGGPLEGVKMTADSNLDWGQDNRRVFELAKSLDVRELKIAMAVGVTAEYAYHGLAWKNMTEEDFRSPAPGYYALDLATYRDQQNYQDSWFRGRKPDFEAGATRYLFRAAE